MKNRYSICVFGILIFVCIAILFFSVAEESDKEQNEPVYPQTMQADELNSETDAAADDSVTSSKTEENYKYIIMEEDGHLLVYYSDNTTLFFDSGIQTKNLPEEVLDKLKTGIRFLNEEELYEFLENYSS
jgi:hypothetical protein